MRPAKRRFAAPGDLALHHLPSADAAAPLSAHEQRDPTTYAEQILIALDVLRARHLSYDVVGAVVHTSRGAI